MWNNDLKNEAKLVTRKNIKKWTLEGPRIDPKGARIHWKIAKNDKNVKKTWKLRAQFLDDFWTTKHRGWGGTERGPPAALGVPICRNSACESLATQDKSLAAGRKSLPILMNASRWEILFGPVVIGLQYHAFCWWSSLVPHEHRLICNASIFVEFGAILGHSWTPPDRSCQCFFWPPVLWSFQDRLLQKNYCWQFGQCLCDTVHQWQLQFPRGRRNGGVAI